MNLNQFAMKPLHKFLVYCILFAGTLSQAQQLPQFTQYMFNTHSINPAYAGSREVLNVTALHRQQWSGLDGNPVTTTLSIHKPLKNEKIGLGLSYISDQLGFEQTNFIYGDFSYSIPISYEAKLSFGLKAGFTNYNRDLIDINDVNAQAVNNWNPNFGAGVYVSTDRWFAGFSSPRILNNSLNLDNSTDEVEAIERNSYYAIGGMVLDLSLDIKFRPTIITKFTNGAPANYDVTAGFLFYEKIWFGASYRFNDANNFGAYLDYQLTDSIRVGYAYDLPT